MSGESGLLVSSRDLQDSLGDPSLRVYDCTVHLVPDPPRTYTIKSGREDYDTSHLPGAGFLDLLGDLSDASSSFNFTMPSPARAEQVLGAAGLSNEHRVVLYSTGHVMWATRVWWMLRSLGFDRAAVLDGGFRSWTDQGRPTCAEPCSDPPAAFKADPRPRLWADKQEVLRAIDEAAVCTINALQREVHSGESPVNYGRKGHIKGSVNVPFPALMERGTFKRVEELRSAFDEVGAFDRERVIVYCGGGISATTDALALVLAGHPNVAVYDGSMSEWSSDSDLPMETIE